jgi:coenzyme F420-dependent glucose-6-phosphate dehydrogenase
VVAFGLTLSSEEHAPGRLVELAVAAEARDFDFVSISDHFHPWLSDQGHSPFVWAVLGAIAGRTSRIRAGTGVTCPTVRIHPTIVAQAAASTSLLFGDRFMFGVGSGEALNEHVVGKRWPPIELRLEMLEEAIGIIRALWSGESITHYGKHYIVEDAKLFDAPECDVPLIVSAFGSASAELAARCGDGLWMSTPHAKVADAFHDAGGSGAVFGQISLCYAEDEDTGRKIGHRYWRTAGVPGQLSQDLPTVSHFETASSTVTEAEMSEHFPCGPRLEPIMERAEAAIAAGVDHLYFHQIGPDQDRFLEFWSTTLHRELESVGLARSS